MIVFIKCHIKRKRKTVELAVVECTANIAEDENVTTDQSNRTCTV